MQPPSSPTGLSTSVALYESGETEYLRLQVDWALALKQPSLITSSTVTATPVKPGPPVLSTTVAGQWASATLGPLQPNTA